MRNFHYTLHHIIPVNEMKNIIKYPGEQLYRWILVPFFLCLTFFAFSQDTISTKSYDEASLFSSEEPLEITIKSDFKNL